MPNRKITEMPWERQKGESAQAFEAFLIYLEMGADRSVQAVSQKLAKSIPLIKRWSSANHWGERCRKWDNHVQREAKKAAIKEVRDMNRRHAQMAVQIQNVAMQALKELGSDLVNQKNFAAIIKLATELEKDSRIAEADAHGGTASEDAQTRNNLLEAILEAEEVDTDDLPEVQ